MSVLYVQQGNKTLFLRGRPDLSESFDGDDNEIVESLNDLELEEKEKEGGGTVTTVKNGVFTFEGIGQRSDVQNANGRIYPRKIWEKLIESEDSPVQEAIKNRRLVGHLEHPSDGKQDGREGAILTTEAKLLEDGSVWHKGEILDTPNGRILQEYALKNIPWGTSTRGSGTVHDDGTVDEDYKLKTWDAVMNPSTPGAFPSVHAGKKNESSKNESSKEDESELKAARDLVERARKILAIDESSGIEFKQAAAREFNRMFGELTRHAAAGRIEGDTAVHLSNALGKRVAHELESASDVTESDAGDRSEKKYHRLVRTLVERLRDTRRRLISEKRRAESLALRAFIHERAYDRAEGKREELEETLEDRDNRISSLEEDVASKDAELETARSSLAQGTGEDQVIQRVVDEAIRRFPKLAEHRQTLESATTVSEVFDVVQSNTPSEIHEDAITEPSPSKKTKGSHPRPALPAGNVKSEGVGKPREPGKPRADESTGASIAASAVNK